MVAYWEETVGAFALEYFLSGRGMRLSLKETNERTTTKFALIMKKFWQFFLHSRCLGNLHMNSFFTK